MDLKIIIHYTILQFPAARRITIISIITRLKIIQITAHYMLGNNLKQKFTKTMENADGFAFWNKKDHLVKHH